MNHKKYIYIVSLGCIILGGIFVAVILQHKRPCVSPSKMSTTTLVDNTPTYTNTKYSYRITYPVVASLSPIISAPEVPNDKAERLLLTFRDYPMEDGHAHFYISTLNLGTNSVILKDKAEDLWNMQSDIPDVRYYTKTPLVPTTFAGVPAYTFTVQGQALVLDTGGGTDTIDDTVESVYIFEDSQRRTFVLHYTSVSTIAKHIAASFEFVQ